MMNATIDLADNERPLIASLLTYPDETLNAAANVISADHFSIRLHRLLWEQVAERVENNEPITPRALRKVRELEKHSEEIRQLFVEAPTAAHIDWQVAQLADQVAKRRLLEAAKLIEEQLGSKPSIELAQEAVNALTAAIGGVEAKKKHWKTAVEVMVDATKAIEEAQKNQGRLLGYTTGFESLDKVTNGLQPGRLYVVAARPGQGKSVLGMQLAVDACKAHGVPVAIFSMEMPDEEVGLRLIASESGVNAQKLTGKEQWSERDFHRMLYSTEEMRDRPIYVRDQADLNRLSLRMETRKIVSQFGVKVIVLDYLQLIQTTGGVKERRYEIGEITKTCKHLAKEYDIAFIVISQLNRDADGKQATLSNLADSDEIGRDADVVLTIGMDQDTIDVIKNRGGRIGQIPVRFIGENFRFQQEEYA